MQEKGKPLQMSLRKGDGIKIIGYKGILLGKQC